MDDELQSLEVELKQLRPRAPSTGLVTRIERDLTPPRRAGGWSWVALPLAAALAVFFYLRPEPATDTPIAVVSTPTVKIEPVPPLAKAEIYKPVATENVLYDSRDDGIITLADGTRAHRTCNAYVDTIVWRNPETKASLRWSVPRNEVRVVPVKFQ
ncbi:MAG: hypothetical protein KA257_09315 [Opitutaceae bacterium]|nr:hypothetical protein [Opitutaceae bacterium]MBP9912803.1 hypothetical protein [Opitutaceae bacterium]